MGKARAEIEITATSSRLASGLAAASRQVSSWAATMARGVGSAFNSVSRSIGKMKPGEHVKNAAAGAGGDLVSRGVDAVLDSANDVRDFERKLVRLQIAAGKTPAAMAPVRNSIRQTSRDVGIDSKLIQGGANAYLALTGDVEGATGAVNAFGRIAQATDAPVSDVATATAALKEAMKLDVAKDTEAAFSALLTQGKAGAVEVKDFAGELAELAPQFAQFKDAQGLAGIREMGAAFQVIRKGAGSASGAATQFSAVMSQLVDPANVAQLKALKINVFDAKGNLRGFSTIIGEISKNKLLNDPRIVAKIFGREEARRALRTLRANVDEMENLRKAGEDTGAVQRDLTEFLTSDAGRVDLAMNNLKETIASVFTPERLTGFATGIEGLVEKAGMLGSALGVVADVFGGIYGVGQSVQKFFTTDDKFMGAFGGSAARDARARTIASGGARRYDPDAPVSEVAAGRGFTAITDPAMQARVLAEAQRDIAAQGGYQQERDRLLGLASGGKTTKESTSEAVIAAMGGRRGGGDMTKIVGTAAYGRAEAGEAYIRGTNMTPEQVASVFAEYMKQQTAITEANGRKFAETVERAFANLGVTFKIGDNQIAQSAKQATDARRAP